MPVYNAGRFLNEAIDSILQQTLASFEFLIIDDASTDNSVKIIQAYHDDRIHLIRKPVNTGYTDSLNMAVKLSRGKYIARMDADDVSMLDRFQQQFDYMETHPGVLVLGTAYKILDTGELIVLPPTFEALKVVAIMQVPVAHPTVFIRRQVFDDYCLWYNKALEPAEDYDLWTRVLEMGRIENLTQPLLHYRRHSQQQTLTRYHELIEGAVSTRLGQLNKLVNFEGKSYDVLFAIKMLTMHPQVLSRPVMNNFLQLIHDMEQANKTKKKYDRVLLNSYLRERWQFYILQFNRPGRGDISMLVKMQSSRITRMGVQFSIKYILKCLRPHKTI
ncbi:MAG: hypothetical protein JWP81_1931 [Ferruginibacter sp.]|nr:hypothetical protein [Ferruginibacter sp.]